MFSMMAFLIYIKVLFDVSDRVLQGSEDQTNPPPTHPVDEDVSWQCGVGLLQAAKAIHHPAVVEGQRDRRQTASCATKQT